MKLELNDSTVLLHLNWEIMGESCYQMGVKKKRALYRLYVTCLYGLCRHQCCEHGEGRQKMWRLHKMNSSREPRSVIYSAPN